MKRLLETRWPELVLAAVVCALYVPSLGNGLTNFDDPAWILRNPHVAAGARGLVDVWTTPFAGGWYPLTYTTEWLIQAVAGTSPFAHHLTQLLLFALATALLPAALASFTVERRAALAITLLWAVHPLRVESVAWAANLKDDVSLVFAVAAFAARRRPAAHGLFLAALLGKSTLFPLALLFVFRDRLFATPLRSALRAHAVPLAGALVVAIVASQVHFADAGLLAKTHPGGSLVAALPSIVAIPWWYVAHVAAPVHLQAAYDFVPVRWADPRLAFAVAGWVALAVTRMRVRKENAAKFDALVAGWLLPLAPVSGLVPLVFHVADRYALVSSIAMTTAFVAIVARVLSARFAVGLAVATSILLAFPTVSRERAWASGITLWEAELAAGRAHWVAHFNLAGAYGAERRWDDAITQLRQAFRMAPDRDRLVADLTYARAAKLGLPIERIRAISGLLRDAPDLADRVVQVATGLAAGPDAALAPGLVEDFLSGRDDARVRTLAAQMALVQGDVATALVHADRAVQLDPRHVPGRVMLALALAADGRPAEAEKVASAPATNERDAALLEATRTAIRALSTKDAGSAAAFSAALRRLGELGVMPAGDAGGAPKAE